jgi:hypothetical protein
MRAGIGQNNHDRQTRKGGIQMSEPVEIGFLCRKGHFIFYDEPEFDGSCGSKKMAGIFVVPEEGVYPHMFAESLAEARQDFGHELVRMYPPDLEN